MRSIKGHKEQNCSSCLTVERREEEYSSHFKEFCASRGHVQSALELQKKITIKGIGVWLKKFQRGLFPFRIRNGALSKGTPLPQIQKSKSPLVCDYPLHLVVTEAQRDRRNSASSIENVNFNYLFKYIDSAAVIDWLKRARGFLHELRIWCQTRENFVRFARFWLSELPYSQKVTLVQLEVGIIKDELRFLFVEGLDSDILKPSDLLSIFSVVLPEYPKELLYSSSRHVFLDYLFMLSSEQTMEYKRMLSSVKYSTQDLQVLQWLLAIRVVALINLWYAVVKFYQSLHSNQFPHGEKVKSFVSTNTRRADVIKERAFQCVQLGYVDILDYLIKQQALDPCVLDKKKRSLVFLAVLHNQPKILEYLIKVDPKLGVNQASETGSTALHAAVTMGSMQLVSLLLQFPRINVNAKNQQCAGATALHLAVLYAATRPSCHRPTNPRDSLTSDLSLASLLALPLTDSRRRGNMNE
nr:PREDICTED: protein FAM220A isoform X2 [Latimeria chalumnae]|eukprot:XP_014345355.1 PREDICTED: protein FAM220A isoform X2 [Latimeria chalumnae]